MTSPLTLFGPGPVYRDERGQIWLFENPYQPMRLWHAPEDRAYREPQRDQLRLNHNFQCQAKRQVSRGDRPKRGRNVALDALLERLHA